MGTPPFLQTSASVTRDLNGLSYPHAPIRFTMRAASCKYCNSERRFNGQGRHFSNPGLIKMLVPVIYDSSSSNLTEGFTVEKLTTPLQPLTLLGRSPDGTTFRKLVFLHFFERVLNDGHVTF